MVEASLHLEELDRLFAAIKAFTDNHKREPSALELLEIKRLLRFEDVPEDRGNT